VISYNIYLTGGSGQATQTVSTGDWRVMVCRCIHLQTQIRRILESTDWCR